jgi:hypothetical protein
LEIEQTTTYSLGILFDLVGADRIWVVNRGMVSEERTYVNNLRRWVKPELPRNSLGRECLRDTKCQSWFREDQDVEHVA